MLLPMLYHLADVIAFFNVVVVGKTLHYMYGLIMADVIAKWQDGPQGPGSYAEKEWGHL